MPQCSCIRGVYNFSVKTIDKSTIVYQDHSDWMDESGYVVPTEYVVNVTPPASVKSYPVTIKVGQLNRLTATDIGKIIDGVYCFETTSCGEKYTRSVMLFPILDCCVKQLWATSDKHEEIREIETHLKLASISAGLNNVQTASKELKIARILLDNIKCDCNC